jgi:hypothetical protein
MGGDVREIMHALGIDAVTDYNAGACLIPDHRSWRTAKPVRGRERWGEALALHRQRGGHGTAHYVLGVPETGVLPRLISRPGA